MLIKYILKCSHIRQAASSTAPTILFVEFGKMCDIIRNNYISFLVSSRSDLSHIEKIFPEMVPEAFDGEIVSENAERLKIFAEKFGLGDLTATELVPKFGDWLEEKLSKWKGNYHDNYHIAEQIFEYLDANIDYSLARRIGGKFEKAHEILSVSVVFELFLTRRLVSFMSDGDSTFYSEQDNLEFKSLIEKYPELNVMEIFHPSSPYIAKLLEKKSVSYEKKFKIAKKVASEFLNRRLYKLYGEFLPASESELVDEQEIFDEQEIPEDQETHDEQETSEDLETTDEQEIPEDQETHDEQETSEDLETTEDQETHEDLETTDEQETLEDEEIPEEQETSEEQESSKSSYGFDQRYLIRRLKSYIDDGTREDEFFESIDKLNQHFPNYKFQLGRIIANAMSDYINFRKDNLEVPKEECMKRLTEGLIVKLDELREKQLAYHELESTQPPDTSPVPETLSSLVSETSSLPQTLDDQQQKQTPYREEFVKKLDKIFKISYEDFYLTAAKITGIPTEGKNQEQILDEFKKIGIFSSELKASYHSLTQGLEKTQKKLETMNPDQALVELRSYQFIDEKLPVAHQFGTKNIIKRAAQQIYNSILELIGKRWNSVDSLKLSDLVQQEKLQGVGLVSFPSGSKPAVTPAQSRKPR
ncbi:MAG: hypothetical protein LBJ09_03230 [Clostridiales bacterium]|jgi:hypothetical protein|nr:hypothetical protein [Clostridiales bacterium]